MHKKGNRLILEQVKKKRLLSVLTGLKKLDEVFPDIDEKMLPRNDITI